MWFNEKKIESSIHFNDLTWLYSVEILWIKRQFDQVYYNFQGIQKIYNIDENFINKWVNIKNTLLWITKIWEYYIICFISLDTLESNYYFVQTFQISSFQLLWESGYIFIYKDYNWKILYKHSQLSQNFVLSLIEKDIILKNNIFDTQVLKINISKIQKYHIKKAPENKEDIKNSYIDIADFYIYEDFFIKNNKKNFDEFLQFFLFQFTSILWWENKYNIKKYDIWFYPVLKINLKIILWSNIDFSCNDFRKLLFCFFSESIVWNYINNKNISRHFSENIIDLTDFEIHTLTSEIKLPKDIFLTDESFYNIRIDLLKLRHNLFLLKENYQIIKDFKNVQSEVSNLYLSQIRTQINEDQLEKTILIYESYLKKYLNNLMIWYVEKWM